MTSPEEVRNQGYLRECSYRRKEAHTFKAVGHCSEDLLLQPRTVARTELLWDGRVPIAKGTSRVSEFWKEGICSLQKQTIINFFL